MKYISKTVDELKALATEKHEEYVNGDPFPNIYFDNFFKEEVLEEVLSEWPDMNKEADFKFKDRNQIKLASKGEYRFGDKTKEFMHFLNSQPFLEFLSILTGIDALLPDPYFDGGGLHQINPGGLLKVHADFNKNKFTGLDRRLNILIYLNKDWEESYGGHFELWDKTMSKAEKKILPVFNRMAMFSTTSYSYHGHPNPLTCPQDRSRRSLALYYYTNGRPAEEVVEGMENHSTIFKARKGENTYSMRDFAKDLVPPILIKGIKKVR